MSGANQVRIDTRIGRFDIEGRLAEDCREIAGLFAEDKLSNADKLAPKLKREL